MPSCSYNFRNDAPVAYLKAAREIHKHGDPSLQELRIGLVGSYTLNFLTPYLVVEGAKKGFLIREYIGPFNQTNQQLLDPKSALLEYQPNIIIILNRFEDFFPGAQGSLTSLNSTDVKIEIKATLKKLFAAIKVARREANAHFIILNFIPPPWPSSGIADAGSECSEAGFVATANAELAKLSKNYEGVFIADWAHFVMRIGYEACFDSRLWYWSRNPLKQTILARVGSFLVRSIAATVRPCCKCLVVDLDDTLWGGIIGEDSIDGIELSDAYPGNVYKDFQKYLLRLRRRGILLAIASKNNYEDVAEVFRHHEDCVLTLDDFSAVEIHWDDKPNSLRNIADTLNIGLDSIAFFDDNPVERELVQQLISDIHVIDVPVDPLRYIEAVEDSGLFDQYSISPEDIARHEMYVANRKRSTVQRAATDLQTFLLELELCAEISVVKHSNLTRVSQLIGKTNQFNLTLRRHNSVELEGLLREGAIGLSMRLTDRFGDNGLIAVAIAVPNKRKWEVDTFLMSCRVLGRQAETLLLAELIEKIRQRGGAEVIGLYNAGPKNNLVANFYKQHGFVQIENNASMQQWRLGTNGIVARPSIISVTRVD